MGTAWEGWGVGGGPSLEGGPEGGQQRFPQTLHGFVFKAPIQCWNRGELGWGEGWWGFQNNAADQPEHRNAPLVRRQPLVPPPQTPFFPSPHSPGAGCSLSCNLELLSSCPKPPHPQPFSFPSSISWPGLSPFPPRLIFLARVLNILWGIPDIAKVK